MSRQEEDRATCRSQTELEKELLQRDAEWESAASSGRDLERIVSYWTDDAVLMPPGHATVVGKQALRAYVQASMQTPGFHITWKSTEVRFSRDGHLAYMFAHNLLTMCGADGPVTIAGRGITIWRRDSDGEWRCAVDIWNAER